MTISLVEFDIFDGTPIEIDLKDEDEMNAVEEDVDMGVADQ